MTANGTSVNGVNGTAPAQTHQTYQYSKEPLGNPRPIRIVVIGCGVSGIAAVKMFKDRFHNLPVELTLYERNKSVGGTWFENRYPG